MGRKSHNKDRDWAEIEKYKAREKKYKREISRLRKIVQKLQDEHEMRGILELVEVQRKEDKQLHETESAIDLKERWQCHKCNDGVMILQIFNRLDGAFYYRRCYLCSNKTGMKKYNSKVQGVSDEDLMLIKKGT